MRNGILNLCGYFYLALMAISTELLSNTATQEVRKNRECHLYHSNIMDGESFFSNDSLYYYLLIKRPSVTKKGSAKHHLIRVNLKNLAFNRLISLKVKGSPKLISHGSPIEGISFFQFSKYDGGCNLGSGEAYSVLLGKKPKIGRSLPKGYYKVFPSDKGLQIGDLKLGVIKSIDVKTFQVRKGSRFKNGDVPLYWNYKKGIYYSFNDAGNGSLYRYSVNGSKPQAQLKLSPAFKIIQNDDVFAVLKELDAKENRFAIIELNAWTGRSGKYNISLPGRYKIEQGMISVDFNKRNLLIYGKFPLRKRKWNKAFIIDYSTNKIIDDFDVKSGYFVSRAHLTPDGTKAIFVTERYSDRTVGGITVYDFESKKWEAVHLVLAN